MKVYNVEAGWELMHNIRFDGLDIRYATFSPFDDRIVRYYYCYNTINTPKLFNYKILIIIF